jgi:hypothetical protein
MQPREGDGAGKRNLDSVVPELLELITTLSADQQRSVLGILSKASVCPPKKRSRLQQREQQPAVGSLEAAPCQSKEHGTTTAPNAGVDCEKAKNAGIVETHLHRDTTGTFRIAFHYTSEIRQRTVDWIRTNCGQAASQQGPGISTQSPAREVGGVFGSAHTTSNSDKCPGGVHELCLVPSACKSRFRAARFQSSAGEQAHVYLPTSSDIVDQALPP